MHCWIEVDAKALQHNFDIFSKLLPNQILAPIIKSNAYGHGLKEIFSILKVKTPKYLGVAYLHEAKLLRDLGYSGKLMIVAPVLSGEFSDAQKLDVEILITHDEHLDGWLTSSTKPKCHLKFDTGLTRQGFASEGAASVVAKTLPFKDLVVGVCTHFANVEDVLDQAFAELQLKRFETIRGAFLNAKFSNLLFHTAASAAALILPESRLDLCRVGISLYGLWPSQATRLSFAQIFGQPANLRPVLSWKTSVYLTKDVSNGSFVGYGCTFKAHRDMKVAVLPLGYFEGYPRIAANNKSYVLIHGQRCPLVGRISMNLMVVDVSHVVAVKAGDEVVLIGTQGSETVSAEIFAEWSDTIHYESLVKLHPAIERRVV